MRQESQKRRRAARGKRGRHTGGGIGFSQQTQSVAAPFVGTAGCAMSGTRERQGSSVDGRRAARLARARRRGRSSSSCRLTREAGSGMRGWPRAPCAGPPAFYVAPSVRVNANRSGVLFTAQEHGVVGMEDDDAPSLPENEDRNLAG